MRTTTRIRFAYVGAAPCRDEVVLLTGASGFIGGALVQRLARDYRIVALVRAGPPTLLLRPRA